MSCFAYYSVILLCVACPGVTATANEMRLLHDLFGNYSKIVRPVINSSQPIEVKLGAALQQIIEMDEKNQVITVNLWMRLQWTDFTLTWNPAAYGNTSTIIVPVDDIWRPDIVLYTNVDSSFSGMMKTNAAIDHNGVVTYNAPAIYTSTCKIDVSYFPFDEQNCEMKFGSWSYNGFQVDLTNRSATGDTSAYIDSGEWALAAMPVYRHVLYYSCCESPYPDVRFNIIIRRRPLFYMFNLLVPCFLVSLITALDFYMPADSGEKVTLGITILLALTVFLLLVAETMPPQSEVVPLIGQYYSCTMLLVSFSTMMTVFVLSLHYRLPGTKPVPKWMKTFFLKHVANWLFLGDLEKQLSDMNANTSGIILQNNEHSNPLLYTVPEMIHQPTQSYSINGPLLPTKFENNLSQIVRELRSITSRYQERDADEVIMTEWKYLAVVMDRLFFWVFLLSTLICSIGILCQPKPFTNVDEL